MDPTAPITIGGVTAAAGARAEGTLQIQARDGDPGTIIPFSIIRGQSNGPVLLLVAGTHGSEYTPIIALQRLRGSIDPATLRGTVLMIHVANMPSFLGRTVYYSPVDGKNLNRVFPGKADGCLSERIAHAITNEFIARATHVLDLHGGDGNESLQPYSYWITTGDPNVVEAGKAMAAAFGLRRIIVDGSRPTDAAASSFLSNTAITRGKPGVTTEAGDMGTVDEEAIGLVERGVTAVLRHLGMRDDGPVATEAPIWIDKDVVLRAGVTGLFYPAVVKGQTVEQGDAIGRITDFHGKTLEEITATFEGEILYIVATPPISQGEPIGMIGASSSRAKAPA